MSYELFRNPKVIFIFGPTATGKSELAIRAAEQFGGEIINCDSVQMFESVNIGTAKPSASDLSRAPHHLIGTVKEGETYTAGQYQRDALEIIKNRSIKGINIFYVVGGSGFYAQALEKGVFPSAAASPEIKDALARELSEAGLEKLFEELQERDPVYANKIGARDKYRILRALEVLRGGKFKTMREVQNSFTPERRPFVIRKIALNRRRTVLRGAIRHRAEQMLKSGFIEEVTALREKGLGEWGPMQSVGYKEVQLFQSGKLGIKDLAPLIETSTMQLAKRQVTWFRRDPETVWFDPDFSDKAPLKFMFEIVRSNLPQNAYI